MVRALVKATRFSRISFTERIRRLPSGRVVVADLITLSRTPRETMRAMHQNKRRRRGNYWRLNKNGKFHSSLVQVALSRSEYNNFLPRAKLR